MTNKEKKKIKDQLSNLTPKERDKVDEIFNLYIIEMCKRLLPNPIIMENKLSDKIRMTKKIRL